MPLALDHSQMVVHDRIVHHEARVRIDHEVRYLVDEALVDHPEVLREVQVLEQVRHEVVHLEVVRQDQLAAPQVQDEINR